MARRPIIVSTFDFPEGPMAMTSLERAEAAEHAMSQELDRIVVKSAIYTSGERDPRQPLPPQQAQGKLYMMGGDPPPSGPALLPRRGLRVQVPRLLHPAIRR